jgi:hypothetical protein
MATSQIVATGTALVTAPAKLDRLVPSAVKESAAGQAVAGALRAV